MDAAQIVNEPARFTVAGRVLRVKAVGMMQKLAIAERCYIERQVGLIRQKAEAFTDPQERAAYITQHLDAIPTGEKLHEDIEQSGATPEMVCEFLRAAVVDPAITLEEAEALLRDGTNEEVTPLIQYVKNGSLKKKEGASAPRKSRK